MDGEDRWQALDQVCVAPDGVDLAVTAIDLDTGETYACNGSERFRSASTIKTLILAALAQAVDRGDVDLGERIALPPDRKLGGSGVLNWLTDGIELPLADYAWLMIAISDNTASNVCIDAVGLKACTSLARSLDLPAMTLARYFQGRSAEPGQPENWVTSNDLARLFVAIATGAVASPEQTAWMLRLHSDQQLTRRLPRQLPDEVSYLGKTGTISEHMHDCGILTGPRGRVAVAALTRGPLDPYQGEELFGRIGRQVALLTV